MPLNKIIYKILLLGIVAVFLFNTHSCYAKTVLKENVYKEPEKILQNYLKARSNGLYKECKKYISDEYLDKFSKEYGTDFTDYFQNQNEDYYKDSRVLKKGTTEKGVIIITVSTIVEGPGYNSRAIESYFLNKEKGYWKITNWKIEYQD